MDIHYHRIMKDVDRLSGVTKLRSYNLLEHSYMVATLFKKFASIENVSYTMVEFDMVMNHDILESITGDLSYEVKNFSKKTKECWEEIENEILTKHPQLQRYSDKNLKTTLTERQFALFKACDILDLRIFLGEEIKLGNTNKRVIEIYYRCGDILDQYTTLFPKLVEFYKNYEA